MKNGKWRLGVLLFIFIFALMALGGCGGSDNKTPTPEPQAGVLDDWKGEWKSFYGSMNAPEVDAICEKAAASLSAYTKKGVKSAMGQSYRTDFDSLKVEGSGITFMDLKGASLGTLTYAFRGVEKRKFGTFDLEWHQFEAVSDTTDKVKMYKYLVMFKVHSDTPEGVKHWHMRYGGESFKALIDDAGKAMWWPTLCAPGDVARLLKDMGTPDAVKEIVDMFKDVNPLDAWQGTWINAVSFLDKPEMNSVYEAVAKKASEMGKSYTPEAVKAFVKKMQASDFAGGMKLKGNQVVFLDEKGGVKETVTYVYDGMEQRVFSDKIPVPMPWAVFKSEAAGTYKYLALLPAGKDTEDGFIHFHMRYGDKGVGDLVDNKSLELWFPTLCASGTTAAKFASDMQAGAEELVMMMEMDKVVP